MGLLKATKHLLIRAEARETFLRGTTALADAYMTLGPRSKCVLIDNEVAMPARL